MDVLMNRLNKIDDRLIQTPGIHTTKFLNEYHDLKKKILEQDLEWIKNQENN